jgi:hypothetical protein
VRRLAEAGYGGIVTNVSFADYLRDEHSWQILREGLQAARELGLVVWLYDEQGYPSGTAGGLVLEGHPELQASGLTYHWQDGRGPGELALALPEGALVYAAAAPVSGSRLRLHEACNLTAQAEAGRPLRWTAPEGHWRLMAFVQQSLYEGTHGQLNLFKPQPYINLLEPRAAARFIELTHEAYRRHVGDFFGAPVQAFFTDEPSLMTGFVSDTPVPHAALPWAAGLPERFQAAHGFDLIPWLPALFNDVGEETAQVRAQFYDLVAQLCADTYFGPIQAWCRAHGLAATGHVLWEEFLLWHVPFEGSAFSALRRFDIPGMDRLSSNPCLMDLDEARGVSQLLGPDSGELREAMRGARLGSYADLMMARKGWAAAKLVSSVAHCTGARQAMVELSAALEKWRGEKIGLRDICATLNWLYALGINTVTSYYDWQAFSLAENRAMNEYAGRLGVLTTQGCHVADVAVLYPITGVWPHFVPARSHVREMEQAAEAREVNDAFDEIGRVLLTRQRDFDFLDDEALAEAVIADGVLHLKGERYRALILPPMSLIRRATAQKAFDFCAAGGIVIAVGRLPEHPQDLFDRFRAGPSGFLVAGPDAMVDVLDAHLPADVRIIPRDTHILYLHRRMAGQEIYFFVNHNPAAVSPSVNLRAMGRPTLWAPATGETGRPLSYIPVPGGIQVALPMAGYEAVFVVLAT